MTISNSSKLKRSNDRKVANAVSKNGKTPTIANTFGLPAGKNFSCPGATSIVRAVLLHNWELLRNADMDTMCLMIDEMIVDFVADCEKKSADKLFRIHWDGDFFNDTYAYAWKTVIANHPDVQFWVYTRVKSAALILKDIPNLSLYYSTDDENKDIAHDLRKNNSGIKLAYLGKTFAVTENTMKELIGKPGAKCPENAKRIPLISTNGSACVSCGLCVFGKADVRFSATKK